MKILSKEQVRKCEFIKENIHEFRNRIISEHIERRDPHSIYNSDQMGINLEIYSKRTLAFKGCTEIHARVQSTRSITHSYTTQFLINLFGELIGPLFIILQESNGIFGPIVQQNMFKHPEIYAVPTKSGKLTTERMLDWFQDIFFANVDSGCVLILDSFTTYRKDDEIDRIKPFGFDYIKEIIPAGGTGFCQPLDVGFNRTYKSFLRRISDHVNFNQPNVQLHQRNNILKLNAFVYYQFKSPRFQSFIRHAWKASGLWSEETLSMEEEWYDNPLLFCFDVFELLTTSCFQCQNRSMIRCAWCKNMLCFEHFFFPEVNDIHYCQKYIQ